LNVYAFDRIHAQELNSILLSDKQTSFRQDAETSTLEACAPRIAQSFDTSTKRWTIPKRRS
jgi:hypothetical protein